MSSSIEGAARRASSHSTPAAATTSSAVGGASKRKSTIASSSNVTATSASEAEASRGSRRRSTDPQQAVPNVSSAVNSPLTSDQSDSETKRRQSQRRSSSRPQATSDVTGGETSQDELQQAQQARRRSTRKPSVSEEHSDAAISQTEPNTAVATRRSSQLKTEQNTTTVAVSEEASKDEESRAQRRRDGASTPDHIATRKSFVDREAFWSNFDEEKKKFFHFFEVIESVQAGAMMKVRTGVAGESPANDSFPVLKGSRKCHVMLFWNLDVDVDRWSIVFFEDLPPNVEDGSQLTNLQLNAAFKVVPLNEISEVYLDPKSVTSFRFYRGKEATSCTPLSFMILASTWADAIYSVMQLHVFPDREALKEYHADFQELMKILREEEEALPTNGKKAAFSESEEEGVDSGDSRPQSPATVPMASSSAAKKNKRGSILVTMKSLFTSTSGDSPAKSRPSMDDDHDDHTGRLSSNRSDDELTNRSPTSALRRWSTFGSSGPAPRRGSAALDGSGATMLTNKKVSKRKSVLPFAAHGTYLPSERTLGIKYSSKPLDDDDIRPRSQRSNDDNDKEGNEKDRQQKASREEKTDQNEDGSEQQRGSEEKLEAWQGTRRPFQTIAKDSATYSLLNNTDFINQSLLANQSRPQNAMLLGRKKMSRGELDGDDDDDNDDGNNYNAQQRGNPRNLTERQQAEDAEMQAMQKRLSRSFLTQLESEDEETKQYSSAHESHNDGGVRRSSLRKSFKGDQQVSFQVDPSTPAPTVKPTVTSPCQELGKFTLLDVLFQQSEDAKAQLHSQKIDLLALVEQVQAGDGDPHGLRARKQQSSRPTPKNKTAEGNSKMQGNGNAMGAEAPVAPSSPAKRTSTTAITTTPARETSILNFLLGKVASPLVRCASGKVHQRGDKAKQPPITAAGLPPPPPPATATQAPALPPTKSSVMNSTGSSKSQPQKSAAKEPASDMESSDQSKATAPRSSRNNSISSAQPTTLSTTNATNNTNFVSDSDISQEAAAQRKLYITGKPPASPAASATKKGSNLRPPRDNKERSKSPLLRRLSHTANSGNSTTIYNRRSGSPHRMSRIYLEGGPSKKPPANNVQATTSNKASKKLKSSSTGEQITANNEEKASMPLFAQIEQDNEAKAAQDAFPPSSSNTPSKQDELSLSMLRCASPALSINSFNQPESPLHRNTLQCIYNHIYYIELSILSKETLRDKLLLEENDLLDPALTSASANGYSKHKFDYLTSRMGVAYHPPAMLSQIPEVRQFALLTLSAIIAELLESEYYLQCQYVDDFTGFEEFIFVPIEAILVIDLDQRGSGLFRFILDTANADCPILHTKHQRSIPIFQDFVHDSHVHYDDPEFPQSDGIAACVMKATDAAAASNGVSRWLQQLVALRTTGQLPLPSMEETLDANSGSRGVAMLAVNADKASLEESIALL